MRMENEKADLEALQPNSEIKDIPPNSLILFTFDMDSMTIDEVKSLFNTIKEQFHFHPVVSVFLKDAI